MFNRGAISNGVQWWFLLLEPESSCPSPLGVTSFWVCCRWIISQVADTSSSKQMCSADRLLKGKTLRRDTSLHHGAKKLNGCQWFSESFFIFIFLFGVQYLIFTCKTEPSWTYELASTNTNSAECCIQVVFNFYIVWKIRNLGALPTGSVCECQLVPLQSSALMSTRWSRTYLW